VRTTFGRALTCTGNALCLATNSLKKHAETKLKPSCSPSNLHLCDDAKKAEVLVCAVSCVHVRVRAESAESSCQCARTCCELHASRCC